VIRRRTIAILMWLLAGGCGSTAADVRLDAPTVPRVPERVQVAEEVGRLLSPDPALSKAAARRLVALEGERQEEFLAYAKTLEGERDPRLLNVLDEHQALPAMPTAERIDFLLWKAARPERFYVMKAQSRLIDLAREDPDALIARVQEGGEGADVLAVVLAVTRTQKALPALLGRYRDATSQRERAATAEALGILAGEERRPRASGTPEEIAGDAATLEAWYREQLDLAAERSSVPPPVEGGVAR